MTLPAHPNVRKCTHIKVTGQQCGSPALRGEFFCYFHTRVIKGVQQRVDMRLDSMALLEDCESIQLSIMHVVDGLVKGTLDPTRARLIIQALRIAARNAKNVRFDDVHYRASEQPMVRQVPDYARQYLIEHPEFGPPLSKCGTGALARDAAITCGPDTPVREAKATNIAEREVPTVAAAQQNDAPIPAIPDAAAERRKHAAHGASRGTNPENDQAPQERKKPQRESQADELDRVQAAIPGAERGNWRDLRTVFEFAGISQNKDAPS
ncbi:MAG TPA: hypothetical protein VNZ03_21465 [Terriglobales bacterium]|nr:hypothetical protein [Terriglobales bacterium]